MPILNYQKHDWLVQELSIDCNESKLKIARCRMSPRNEKGDSSMGPEKPHPLQIELQLTETLWRRAEESALSEGISLQDFILYAIGEKIASSEPPDKT